MLYLNFNIKLYLYYFINFLISIIQYFTPYKLELFLTNYYMENLFDLNFLIVNNFFLILFIISCFCWWKKVLRNLKEIKTKILHLNININIKNYFIATGLIFYLIITVLFIIYALKFHLNVVNESVFHNYIYINNNIYNFKNQEFIILFFFYLFIFINIIHFFFGLYMFYYDYITDQYLKLTLLTIYILYIILIIFLINNLNVLQI